MIYMKNAEQLKKDKPIVHTVTSLKPLYQIQGSLPYYEFCVIISEIDLIIGCYENCSVWLY